MTDASDDPIEPEAAADESDVDATASPGTVDAAAPTIDLEAIERDLEGVGMALTRLDDGTYWTDEVTGDPLADQLLVADPVARRNR